MPDSTFEIWLAPLHPRAIVGDTLVVTAPDEIRSWVADRFGRVLQTCAASVLGPATTVDVIAPGAALDERGPAGPTAERGVQREPEPEFHPKLTFDQFVIGASNRFAHAAALAVAEMPGQAYNPLFLYGPPGLGKTHLLHAIGNYICAHGGGLRVRSTTAERFTNEFVAAHPVQGHRGLQGPLPRDRRPAHRRRPVPAEQGEDRGGVLPHVQRAATRPAASSS